MYDSLATPPERPLTAGLMEEREGDVDAEPQDSTLTNLDTDNEIGSDQGGTPGDAAGEMSITGAQAH